MSAQVALVTGANRGIGYEIARGLAAAGMRVLIGARSAQRGREAAEKLAVAGYDVSTVRLDVTDAESVAATARTIEQAYGRLDVLVNNAAVLLDFGIAPSATPLDAVRRTFETNVLGVVAVTNALLPLLRGAPAGRIVNLSSELGSLTAATDPTSPTSRMPMVAYNVSKSAVNAVTVSYANELRDTPIKVNAADPGYCATDMNGGEGDYTPQQGASVAIRLATLPADGPSGGYFNEAGPLPW
ncbi:SDR family oxidoreductase [Micromonospora peucetia]|uniref:NAD(P)-dependent dehydrogenase, short-chain alcohol dehydrogenase family n=1 Tax=Micromonospora peucetia TaxID=47871 RepID=A0A1C6VT86_9ACTN|nr:SDR family oxidoreductase [Micromonospora peucetia]MCX4388212.1 SDR family oxidoreductase [Micromonospora peucetia]WSA31108.1 SDR family oxidoreductase [Micromonospora peucetia]SCL69569.1 NAD(P)-dependent dehydrogenase, short-chain alcohol dehydrogenase family [Micromonospora peucetia]